MQRIPLPAQLDRVILGGSLVAGAILVPVVVALVALLAADQITGPELVWWLLAVVVVTAALGAVLLRNVVHAALSLVVVALGIAGMFLLLASEFLALVQVLVYGGGVTILLLFGLMLTNAQDDPIVQDGSQKPFAFGVGIALGAVITVAMTDATWDAGSRSVVAFRALGERLYRDFGVPFEVASLVLLVALVGAIAISRRDQDEEDAA
ncbi:MAG: NADH-quinone oxidoreductase subunit J [Dehalococcoidia bacterium]